MHLSMCVELKREALEAHPLDASFTLLVLRVWAFAIRLHLI